MLLSDPSRCGELPKPTDSLSLSSSLFSENTSCYNTPKVRNIQLQNASKTNKTPAKTNIVIRTTTELRINSVRVGQDTLFISASTAIKKSANGGQLTRRYAIQNPHRARSPGTTYATVVFSPKV